MGERQLEVLTLIRETKKPYKFGAGDPPGQEDLELEGPGQDETNSLASVGTLLQNGSFFPSTEID